MEIWHFFVIFHDFVMKCVYKSTIYTFVIRDKIWTPPFVVQKCTCYFCVLGPENTPPPPYMSGTFVLAPPRQQRSLGEYRSLIAWIFPAQRFYYQKLNFILIKIWGPNLN